MNYSKKFIVSFVLVMLAGVASVRALPTLYHAYLQVKVKAASPTYTMFQHIESVGPTFGTVTTETRVTAQRGDGSRVLASDIPRSGYHERRISLASGTAMTVYDDVRTVSTTRLNVNKYLERLGASRTPESGCTLPPEGKLSFPNLISGQETISGIVTNNVLISPGVHMWYATGLNCEVIKNTFTFVDDKSVSTLILDKIIYGEPDPSLFAVGDDYEEVQPSRAIEKRLTTAKFNPIEVQKGVNAYKNLDKAYAVNHVDRVVAAEAAAH